MGTLRHFFRNRPALAALLLAAALILRAIVPAGWMPAASPDAGVIVALCSGTMPAGSTVTITIPKKPSHQDHGGTVADHPCAFAPLGDALTGTDFAPLLIAALAFVFVAAILRAPLALRATGARIRPPGRAPPLSI